MEINEVQWEMYKQKLDKVFYTIEGNGKPGLYDKLKSYIDERDDHKERNAQQDLQDFKVEQKENHTENQKKLDRLSQLVYVGMGIMIALESVGLFKK